MSRPGIFIVSAVVAASCSSPQVTPIRIGDAAAGEEDAADRDGLTLSFADGSFGSDAPLVADVAACVGDACAAGDAGAGITCGNGIVEDTETCDDGNSKPGDGCSGVCRVEPNFECPTPGQACRSLIVCGDGMVMGGEACDDKNTMDGDGCSAVCQVEMGYACTEPGKPCMKTPMPTCGDGMVNQGESCDDGNVLDKDGCTPKCALEPGWSCPMPGKPCVKDEYCGDSILNGTEGCDDGNITPGDGCSGVCVVEPFFVCKTAGKPCTSTIVCGDSAVIGDEACDDGNTKGADGCAADCKQVEPGYTCPTTAGVGGPCIKVPQPTCGDGALSYGEYCDDGNKADKDGCSALCLVEPGYSCPTVGMLCKLDTWCGDGKLTVADGEQCDDGNKTGADGCSAQCIVEANYVCPVPGQACQSTIRCGDRIVSGGETCDDGNLTDGDGCSKACAVENGWVCPAGGRCLPAKCGDGLKVGIEQCDDKNGADGDGCSSACTLEGQDDSGAGWVCPTPGQPCVRTVCNNGKKEGSEACDDGNGVVGDGCTPFCQVEPSCPTGSGPCHSRCGDGLTLPTDLEECDDGNSLGGDGCSPACKVEPGYACQADTGNPPDTLMIPVVFRDVIALPLNGATSHPDFQAFAGSDTTPGLVDAQLGVDGKPVFVPLCTQAGVTAACPYDQMQTTKANFDEWYRNTPGVNIAVVDRLPLVRQVDGSYFFPDGNPGLQLFPVDGKGWDALGREDVYNGHNFGFTSEVRYWFQFGGGETLNFSGDDDVWVFINRKLAMDLGGVHPRVTGSITLDATRATQLGLQAGNIYEFVLFHAERHTSESNFNLTLKGFDSSKSRCDTVCGDGIVAGAEACDLGTTKNMGAYGTCNANCTLPPRCGDGVKNGPEECDDGRNVSTYGGTQKVCAPGCVFAPTCGDGTVNSANGEACDEGADNGKGYGHCTAKCQLGPRCGDALITDAEECDEGMANGTAASKCMDSCRLKCGNGMPDAREQCDDGKAANTGGYGKCTAMCLLGPRCGDGIKNGPETCDDGKNDGSYGGCTPTCTLGPRCGDGTVQMTAGEICDLGAANQAMPYGKDKCSMRCRPAPYCGDKAVDGAFGEGCDDGVNSGQPGSCTTDCKAYVPLPSCGDGTVDKGELCDDGNAKNGGPDSKCDTHCRWKCGNGFRDTGEECDDGVNDGRYGTCKADCTLAGYCGDGTKNGPEACDLGAANEANPYGPNKCTTMCSVAPYCGDGRIQSTFGEECDTPDPAVCKMCKNAIIE